MRIKKLMAKEDYFKKIDEDNAIAEAMNKKGGKAPAIK